MNIQTAQHRLALLKEQERELRDFFSQSHTSLAATQEVEFKLASLAAQIADLEAIVLPRQLAKSA